MSAVGAYLLRRQPGAEGFRSAWERALRCGLQSLADLAIDRARNGVLVPVYSYGKLIGERRVYNDRLLMFVLRHRLPERFGPRKAIAGGAEPAGTEPYDTLDEAELKAEEDTIEQQVHAFGRLAAIHRMKLDESTHARLAGDDRRADILAQHCWRLEQTMQDNPLSWQLVASLEELEASIARGEGSEEEGEA